MNFKGGLEEAAKMLQALSSAEQKRILLQISQQNPSMAEKLRDCLIQIEDLQHLTPVMMQIVLRQFSAAELGIALKNINTSIVNKCCEMLSKNNQKDLLEIVNGRPRSLEEVQEMQSKIKTFLREKSESGEIVIKPGGRDEYV